MKPKRDWLVDCLVIACLAAVLIWPIFKTRYYENWLTIDSTFIADARFLMENGPHPGWNNLWYGGTRWDYIYPPGIRYGTASLAKAFGLLPARGYHLYTAIFYALGIMFVYVFARIGSGARVVGWLGAFCAATLTPTFLVLKEMRLDVEPYMPQRLNVLVRYGEGPHMSAFAILPLGLALSWRGLRAGQTRWLAGAAVAFALVVTNNFYGATALAMFFPILTWVVFSETRDWFVFARAAGIAILSWGLCAIWLTPSFLSITARNLALVAQPGNPKSLWLMVALLVGFALVSWKLARQGTAPWTLFLLGANLVFLVSVIGNYYYDFRITGEPSRLVPEADLCIILLLTWAGYRAWNRWPTRTVRIAIALVFILCCVPARAYFEKPWRHLSRTSEYKHRKEFQIADWVDQNRPNTRSYVTGTLRFWWNAWHNGAQLGGGSEQGVNNLAIIPFFWRSVLSADPNLDIAWMQAFAVDNVVVNDKTSALPIADIEHPHKYQGVLPVLWEDGQGNWIYAVPRKHPGLARVVDAARYRQLQPAQSGDDEKNVGAYVDVLEKSTTAVAETRWLGPDTLQVTAETVAGQALAIQVAHDTAWSATEGGRAFPIERDPFGQMRVELPPGRHQFQVRFVTPRENAVGAWVTVGSLGIVLFLLLKRK